MRFLFQATPRSPELQIAGANSLADTHIDDALSHWDALLTFNSGTGVLGFLHGKPVATFGRAFYDGNGLTHKVHSEEDFMAFLEDRNSSFEAESRERFCIT